LLKYGIAKTEIFAILQDELNLHAFKCQLDSIMKVISTKI